MAKSHGSRRRRPETMKPKEASRMTVDVDISDVPELDRIPTAREFQSFDSSISGGAYGDHYARYTVANESSYDKYLDGKKKVGSDDDSGVGPFRGGEDEDLDWYADSFDHYEQRQDDLIQRKSKRMLKQYKKTSLVDEDSDVIEESRTKQSTRKRDLRIYSPPSQGGSTKDLAEALNPSLEEDSRSSERRSSSTSKAKYSVSKKEPTSTRSSRSRSRSPVANECHESTSMHLSPTQQAARSRSPNPSPRDPPDSMQAYGDPISPSNESQAGQSDTGSKASSRRGSSVGKLFSKKKLKPLEPPLKQPMEQPSSQPTESRSSSPVRREPPGSMRDCDAPVSPTNASQTGRSETGSKASSRRSSSVGKLFSKKKKKTISSVKEDTMNHQVASSVSKDSQTRQETIDTPVAAAAPQRAPMVDAATSISIASSFSQSSPSDHKKPPKSPFHRKSFTFQSSSKDEGESKGNLDSSELKSAMSVAAASTHSEVVPSPSMASSPSQTSSSRKKPPKSPFSAKRFSFQTSPKKESEAPEKKTESTDRKLVASKDTQSMQIDKTTYEDSDALNEGENVAEDDEMEGTFDDEKTSSVTKESDEESDSIIKRTNRKAEKAVRLIRSFIKATNDEEEPDISGKDLGESCTASSSKTSSESVTKGNSKDNKQAIEAISSVDKLVVGNEERVEGVRLSPQETTRPSIATEATVDTEQDTLVSKGEPKREPNKLQDEQPALSNPTRTTEGTADVKLPQSKGDGEVGDDKNEDAKVDETKKAPRSRGFFGIRKRGKSNKVEEKDQPVKLDNMEGEAPLEIIAVPSKKMSGVAAEAEINSGEANGVGDANITSQSKEAAAATLPQNMCIEDPEQSKMVETFLRENYCGFVADCLGYWDYPNNDKESIGATNAAVNSRKIKLDSGEIDIDQAVAAMRRSKRMAPLPIKSIDIPHDYIFPSTSSITDSQAAYKGRQARKKKSSEKEEDQKRVKSFLRAKMGRRQTKKKSERHDS